MRLKKLTTGIDVLGAKGNARNLITAQIDELRNMRLRSPGQRLDQPVRNVAAPRVKMNWAQEQLLKQQEHVTKVQEELARPESKLQEVKSADGSLAEAFNHM